MPTATHSLIALRSKLGYCRYQLSRVCLNRLSENLKCRARFDDPAAMHHDDVIGHTGSHAQIMRNEYHPNPIAGLNLVKEVQNVGLD